MGWVCLCSGNICCPGTPSCSCAFWWPLTHESGFLTRLAATTSRSRPVVVIVAQVAHPISLLKIRLAHPEVTEFADRELVVDARRALPIAWLTDPGQSPGFHNTLYGWECDDPNRLQ